MKQDIRKLIGKLLCKYYDDIHHPHTLHTLLEDICVYHNIKILHKDNVLCIYSADALNAYHIIVDVIWHIKLFEKEQVIQFYEQANTQTNFASIPKGVPESTFEGESVKISGGVEKYILEHHNLQLWVHPRVKKWVKNKFISFELAEAKKQTYLSWCSITIALFALLCSLCSFKNNKDVRFQEHDDIVMLYDYSTVDWEYINNLYHRANIGDWNKETGSRINSNFPMEIAVEYWDKLQKTKTYFHQQTLPLRCNASKSIVEALNQTESLFDSIFVKCVGQEYYMRLFPEVYNEVMQPAIDNLCETIRNSQ